MASLIVYTDDTGLTSFSNGLPVPGDRFGNWTPMNPDLASSGAGVEAETLGGGLLEVFEFRTDYGASFEIAEIRQDNVAAAMRLIRHLNRGGTVTVTTGDASSHEYTCRKWKGTKPDLVLTDRKNLIRTLKLTLKSTTAVDMVVTWP